MSEPQGSPPTAGPGPTPSGPSPVPDPVAPKKLERPHPLTPLIRGWVAFVAIGFFLLREMIPDGEPDDYDWIGPTLIAAVIGGIVLLAGLAGFVSWYFTRFVIDDTELRIETGALFKNSKKVPFERVQSVDIIQPLAARVFGLAELRIEVGAGDSTIKLRYLTRRQADGLRDYLLTRAHGRQAAVSGDGGPGASALTDLGSTDVPLVKVTPRRLVASFVLSVEWLSSIVVVIVVLTVTAVVGEITYGLPILIPAAIGAVTLISNRLVSMFNFTLAESPRGFRVVRGLTNLTSQSVPINRIQGVRISQSLLWRRFHWYRVDVNVLGVHHGDSEDNENSATSVLLPVADPDQVRLVLDRILPGLDLSAMELRPAGPRARIVRWYDHWTLRYGFDARVVVTDHGWLTNVRDVVPHAKVQSVRIEQGPLQRRLGLADVHLDLTPGPVTAIARQLAVADARELAVTELDRARAARALDRKPTPMPDRPFLPDPSTQAVLEQFGVRPDAVLGRGGEATVYALDEGRVLRLYHQAGESSAATTAQLRHLYDTFAGHDVGLAFPQVLDAGWIAGRWSSVDRRLPGQPYSTWLATHDVDARRASLLSYLEAALVVRRLPSPVTGFARLVGAGTPQTFETQAELLTAQMASQLPRSQAQLESDLPDVHEVWDALQDDLIELDAEPALVHGDICPSNVFVEERAGAPARVSAIADFSPHTLNADPALDVVGAVAFLELETYPGAAEDAAWLTDRAVEKLGGDLRHRFSVYRRYYGFYFSSTCDFEPATYAWCLAQLRPVRTENSIA